MRTALRKILCEWRLWLLTFGPPWWGLTKFDVPLVYISNSNFYYNNSFKWILAQSLNSILLKNFWGAHITTQISSHAVIVHSVVLIFRFRRFFRASESCLLVSYKETVWFCFWKFFWIFFCILACTDYSVFRHFTRITVVVLRAVLRLLLSNLALFFLLEIFISSFF